MVICPLCEHQQAFGFECEQCGKDLSGLAGLDGLGAPPPNLVAVEGLEVTVPERIGAVAIENVAELQVTRFDDVQVPVEVTPELDTGRSAAVGDVALEEVLDFSRDRAPEDARTVVAAGQPRCRYCGHTQLGSGGVCEKCGVRLPRVAEVLAGVLIGTMEQVKTRCRSCGAPSTAGSKCGDCGRDVPFPDA